MGRIPGERTEESDGGTGAARASVGPRTSQRQRGRPEEGVQGLTVSEMGTLRSVVFAQEPTSRTKTGSLDLFWMCSRTGSTKKRTRKSQATPPGDHKAFFESCRQLKGFVEGEQAMALLACGGTIPIAVPGTETTSPTPAPVNIFWSTSDDSVANKLVLPANGATPESSMDVLQRLISTVIQLASVEEIRMLWIQNTARPSS